MKPIVIVENDRIGLLADISYILAKNKINIETVNVNVIGGKAIIVLTVNDYKKAVDILKKNNYHPMSEEYFVLKLEDKPGELNKISAALAEAKINILNIHLLARDNNNAIIAIQVDKKKAAKKILEKYIQKLEDEEAS